MNVHPKLINIIFNIISNREQAVQIGGCLSDWLLIKSGVPQGSSISPLLFNIFINDIFEMKLVSLVVAFADDLKLYGTPGHQLQIDLNKILDWSSKNGMVINERKCEVIHFGKNNSHFKYSIGSFNLNSKNLIKDLGILIDSKLKFVEHLHLVRSKCHKLTNLIFKIFKIRNAAFYCKLYKIYVIPNIFYGLPIYLTNTCFCINSIEKIQKYFTRRLYQRCFPNENIPNYIDRIKFFNIPTLESQCLKIDLCTLFKILKNMIDVPFKPLFSTRNSSRIIYQPSKSNLFRNSFYHRSLVLWNKFISSRAGSDSLTYPSFVSYLDKNHSSLFFGSASKAA